MRPAGFDTNRTSGAARPAHKFTRDNDFMGLSALSRNFCGRNSYPMLSERIVHADRELRPAIAPSPRRRGAPAKRDESFALRNVRFRNEEDKPFNRLHL